jgi:hypothetical protein
MFFEPMCFYHTLFLMMIGLFVYHNLMEWYNKMKQPARTEPIFDAIDMVAQCKIRCDKELAESARIREEAAQELAESTRIKEEASKELAESKRLKKEAIKKLEDAQVEFTRMEAKLADTNAECKRLRQSTNAECRLEIDHCKAKCQEMWKEAEAKCNLQCEEMLNTTRANMQKIQAEADEYLLSRQIEPKPIRLPKSIDPSDSELGTPRPAGVDFSSRTAPSEASIDPSEVQSESSFDPDRDAKSDA